MGYDSSGKNSMETNRDKDYKSYHTMNRAWLWKSTLYHGVLDRVEWIRMITEWWFSHLGIKADILKQNLCLHVITSFVFFSQNKWNCFFSSKRGLLTMSKGDITEFLKHQVQHIIKMSTQCTLEPHIYFLSISLFHNLNLFFNTLSD